ncbi:M20/M25/M40 family metallo-hydrolase [Arthrobacter pityocampae]|uniref:M20/M25/M40 family metallo-hydrolase n=1 Tax=Arthrobacter pityocampae TaxID=547334 RepID=UPI003735C0A9
MRATSGKAVLVALALTVTFAVAVWFGAAASPSPFPLVPHPTSNATMRQALENADYTDHLAALQEIADGNGGNRTAGTSGYSASAEYVEEVLRDAGYAPVRQPFTFGHGRDAERIDSFNILADTAGDGAHTIVVGAHLDSVRDGPGINDNGSGVAAVLEIARWVAVSGGELRNRVRFAFWGAEEDGLEGSKQYVEQLTDDERDQTVLNLNIDMAGSPNGARFVHDGDGSEFGGRPPEGSDQIEKVFLDYFSAVELPVEATAFDGGSDYDAFQDAGIAVGGLFAGDIGMKSATEAQEQGGEAGVAHDPCYHRSCDDVDNVDLDLVAEMAAALGHATMAFAQGTPAGQ